MTDLDTAVMVYENAGDAEADWTALEAAAGDGQLEITDAALVENRDGETLVWERQSRHGWGKGAVAGAVVGILFPPSLLAAAAVGAGGGALIARMTRALGRDKVKDLGDTLDSGKMAIIVVCPAQSTNAVSNLLTRARTTMTAPSSTAEEIQEAMATGS